MAEDRGFVVSLERTVLEGHGHIDVTLERKGQTVACEICVTTSVRHEAGHPTRCLAAGFNVAVMVCGDERTLASAREALSYQGDRRVHFIVPEEIGGFLDQHLLQEPATLRSPESERERKAQRPSQLHREKHEPGAVGEKDKKSD